MRTIIDIDDQLLVYAKQQAAQQGYTLKQVVENALREFLSRENSQQNAVKLEMVLGAGLKPGIDLDNSRSLNDIRMAVDVFNGCECLNLYAPGGYAGTFYR